MHLSQLQFQDEIRPTTLADQYDQLLQQYSYQGKNLYFCRDEYCITLIQTKSEFLICSELGIYEIKACDVIEIPIAGLQKMNLNCIRWNLPQHNNEIRSLHLHLFNDFKIQSLRMFLNLAEIALHQVYLYLKSRQLTKQSTIQVQIAHSRLQIELLNSMLKSDIHFFEMIQGFKSLFTTLIKLIGGRAMLADNLVEMKWFFDLFTTVYFEGLD
jgi:hypothetical protein